jgi:hypothetical protein
MEMNRMKILTRLTALIIVFSCFSVQTLFAQGRQGDMSVEESYLQESVDRALLREAAANPSRDMKLLAMDIIQDAIAAGNKSDELCESVENLAMEGVVNQVREGGRVLNNYPDVRARAARLLGDIGTENAKKVLTKMVILDPEPMVLFEAIAALTKMGINDNGETIAVISWTFSRFDVISPDNRLAMAVLNAYDKLYEKNGTVDPTALQILRRVINGPYIKPVQDYAKRIMEYYNKNRRS